MISVFTKYYILVGERISPNSKKNRFRNKFGMTDNAMPHHVVLNQIKD